MYLKILFCFNILFTLALADGNIDFTGSWTCNIFPDKVQIVSTNGGLTNHKSYKSDTLLVFVILSTERVYDAANSKYQVVSVHTFDPLQPGYEYKNVETTSKIRGNRIDIGSYYLTFVLCNGENFVNKLLFTNKIELKNAVAGIDSVETEKVVEKPKKSNTRSNSYNDYDYTTSIENQVIKQQFDYLNSFMSSNPSTYVPSVPSFSPSTNSYTSHHTTCPSCYGTGSCHVCGGSGTYSRYGQSQTCSACYGSGRCSICHGIGTIR